VALSHESLVNYYKTNYQLMQNHNWTLSDIDYMIPWEREIYVTLLVEDLKEQKLQQEQQNKSNG
tara:strand:- start:256 stop:447 length:192 start_codon:yes stop_codon:yes gene_type:complete